MKLICNSSELVTNLQSVIRVVPSRPTHPILTTTLVSASVTKQQVTLTGFDLNLSLEASFKAEVLVDGSCCLPARLFHEIVSRLPKEEVTIEVEGASQQVTLTSRSGSYRIHYQEAAEFPNLPVVNTSKTVYLAKELLAFGLQTTLLATSHDETKQVLTGVHVTITPVDRDCKLVFVATDGHRLGIAEFPSLAEIMAKDAMSTSQLAESSLETTETTIPASALRELEAMLKKGDFDIFALHLDEGKLSIESNSHRLTTRVIEGQYPNITTLIPQTFQQEVTIDRRQLLSALERIAVLAEQNNKIVKLQIDSNNQQLTVSVDAKDVGCGQEMIPLVQMSGESIDIAFNVKYLIEAVKVLPSAEVQMHVNTSLMPVIFTPLGGQYKCIELLMPIQIRF